MSDFLVVLRSAGNISRFPRPISIGEETQSSAAYYYDAKTRIDAPHLFFKYSLSGAGIFRDRDGEHVVGAGSGFLCESHDRHAAYYYPQGASEPWRFVFIAFEGEAAYVMSRDLIRQHGPIYQLPANHQVIKRLRMFQVYDNTNQFLPAGEGAQLVTELLTALVTSKEATLFAHPGHVLVRQAMDEIQSRIGERLQVGDVAKALHVSREHLTRVFDRHIAMSPHDYITSSKMLIACRLLRNESLSVKEIASRLGYDNPSQFIRSFHRELRMTPIKFRQRGAIFVNRRRK